MKQMIFTLNDKKKSKYNEDKKDLLGKDAFIVTRMRE